MSPILAILLGLLVVGLLAALLYWLIVTTEGVYLGRGVVIWLYDRFAPKYERIKGYETPVETYFLGRPLLLALPTEAPLVLDVATGTGRLPRNLWGQPNFKGRIVGIDLSRPMLRQAVGRVAEGMHHGRIVLMHGPAEKLPFPDNTFDLVTCLEALEFMSRPRTVIAELVRVTRPGGLLLLSNRIGRDAKLMPGKTWSVEQAYRVYEDEFGLHTEIRAWQFDYDLVWLRKSGESSPVGPRPLEEIWCCPRCAEVAMSATDGGYTCLSCGARVAVGDDGVIEQVR